VKTPEQQKGLHGECGTVKVKADNEQGYVVIDEEDFDDTKHTRFDVPFEESTRPERKSRK
jgi:hypothetical protein